MKSWSWRPFYASVHEALDHPQREDFFKFSLVEVNDQVLESDRLALRACFLVAPEDRSRLAESLICLPETCIEDLARGALAAPTFLNSEIDPKVCSSHCDT